MVTIAERFSDLFAKLHGTYSFKIAVASETDFTAYNKIVAYSLQPMINSGSLTFYVYRWKGKEMVLRL